MREPGETDLELWQRRRSEALALAANADDRLREVHLSLATSYTRLIELSRSSHADGAGGND